MSTRNYFQNKAVNARTTSEHFAYSFLHFLFKDETVEIKKHVEQLMFRGIKVICESTSIFELLDDGGLGEKLFSKSDRTSLLSVIVKIQESEITCVCLTNHGTFTVGPKFTETRIDNDPLHPLYYLLILTAFSS